VISDEEQVKDCRVIIRKFLKTKTKRFRYDISLFYITRVFERYRDKVLKLKNFYVYQNSLSEALLLEEFNCGFIPFSNAKGESRHNLYFNFSRSELMKIKKIIDKVEKNVLEK